MAADTSGPQGPHPSGSGPYRSGPSGVVTLLTDFGLEEAYVGTMKGVLWARSRDLRAVVDLTHAVPPQDVSAATFHLRHAWSWFPRGTVHVAVVDPGVGTERAILVARHEGHLFIAPDNGLLGPILRDHDSVHRLDGAAFERASATFHGRDVFAPAAARLVDGASPSDLGEALEAGAWVPGDGVRARVTEDGVVHARVVHVDHFGNLVLDVPGEALGADPSLWSVEIAGVRVPFAKTYGSVAQGSLLALVDSYGSVEIAESGGSAAGRLAVGRGAPATIRRNA